MENSIETGPIQPNLAVTPPTTSRDNDSEEGETHESLRMEVVFEATEKKRLAAITRSARGLVARILSNKADEVVWNLREVVWPALSLPEFRNLTIGAVRLTLFPLSRIGQMEGKSGSLVLIGFLSVQGSGLPHSHPLVVKTLDRSKSDKDKLGEEYNNALNIKAFAYDRKDSFAIPIDFDEGQAGYSILWSICSTSGDIWQKIADSEAHSLISGGMDLRAPLMSGDVDLADRTLGSVFDLLRNCHTRFGRAGREERVVGQEYDRYLRGLGTIWGQEWEPVWGEAGNERLAGGNINPLWLVNRLKAEKYEMFVGAVHGDLHPGNVVLGRGELPAIIDFGWASQMAHVAKDFVLMECNLRFLTLRLQVRPEEVEVFEAWIAWGSPHPSGLNEYLNGRVRLIDRLREKASDLFPKDTDWDREYLIPLFLVAFGLLRFALQLGNQQAALRFVQSLASHIAARLPS